MGKPKRKNKGNTGPRPVDPEAVLREIEQSIDALAQASPAEAGPMWGAMHKLLLKAKADAQSIMPVIGRRDLDGLRDILRTLRGEETESITEDTTPAEPVAEIDPDTLKKAMRAFRKRLKLARLDHESRLGVGPMSGGKKSDIDAILAPQEFPTEVWEALVHAGDLKRAGSGFYQLVDDPSSA